MKAHWRNLIARYGAYPVIWCAAGEANLPWYLAKGFPYDDRDQAQGWTEIVRYIRATDPWRRPLTVHPTAINQYTSRHAIDDPTLLDFDMLQTPHADPAAQKITVDAVRASCAADPHLPVIDGEASYEMLLDSIPASLTRSMFWLCMTNGAKGHTYGANGIWQLNRPGDPHGKSPHGGTYGKITWEDAMRLPGSTQVALGKKFFETLPWTELQPVKDSAHWTQPGSEPGPQACGAGDGLRIIYSPSANDISVAQLIPGARYIAQIFDPVTGETRQSDDSVANAAGACEVHDPGLGHDWVITLRKP